MTRFPRRWLSVLFVTSIFVACGSSGSSDGSSNGSSGATGGAGAAGVGGNSSGGVSAGGGAGSSSGAGGVGEGGSAGRAGGAGSAGVSGAGGAQGGEAGEAGAAGAAGSSGSRAMQWVRSHPMFLSGLTVSMPPPPVGAVQQYFDEFHANAVHLWQGGMGARIQGWAAAAHPGFRFVSWLRPDGTSGENGQVVGGLAGYAGRIGYQIGDEPCQLEAYHDGDDCDTKQGMKDLEVGIQAVRQADPDGLIIVNFGNVTGGDDELEQIIDYYAETIHGDIISYDQYSMNYSSYEGLERYRRVGLKYGMPYWRYISSYDKKGQHDYPTETDMRWEAFIGLLYGFTGHTWFIYQITDAHALSPSFFETLGSWTAAPTPRFAKAAAINQRMAVFGRTITQLTSTDVRFVPAVAAYTPKATTKWEVGAGGDPYIRNIQATNSNLATPHELAVGFFHDASGEQYVMLQHVNHKSAQYPSGGTKDATVEIAFDFTNAPASLAKDHLQVLDTIADQIVSVKLTAKPDGLAVLQLTLPAGDAILFKYDTGKPFVQGPS